MRDRTVGETFYIAFTTRAFATGIPTQLAGSPVISAYEDAGLTQITAGLTLGVDHDSVTGLNMITVVATGGNGFEAGKDYQLVITAGTVGGVSVVGEVVGQFSLGLSAAFTLIGSRLTAARAGYLDELAAANIPADLTAITGYVDALETRLSAARAGYLDNLNGHTAQTGDNYARIGANGGGLSAVPYNAAWDAEIQSEVADALAVFWTSPATLVSLIWNEILSKGSYNVGQSAAKMMRQMADITQIDGAVSDASPTAAGFNTTLTQADGFFDDAVMVFSNGAANAGIGIPVSTSLNANGAVTFVSPDVWPVTPVNGDDFIIYANHVHPIAQIFSGVLTSQLTEAYAADGVAPTLAQAIFLIQQLLSEFTIAGTTMTVKRIDGSTTAFTLTLNDSTNPTGITRTT